MNVVQYGDWKIAVDVDKTKQFYDRYEKTDNQANRNFAEYCKNLSADEKAFFDAFGIDPVCCEIRHCGTDKKGNSPCGGHYFICGKYLEHPPENLITVEELAAKNFIDDRPDPRIYLGLFRFDFQCEDYEINGIPEDMPEGFICINFWCEDMKWLLSEKPEVIMYEPPRFWEIHKKIKQYIDIRKMQIAHLEETKAEIESFFEKENIKAEPLSKKGIIAHKKEWIRRFSPANAEIKKVEKLCLKSREYSTFLWHIFSFEILNCVTNEEAEKLFDKENKLACILVNNEDNIAYRLESAQSLTAESLKQFLDVTITATDFTWTYSKTHEEYCGPYFYKK